MDIKDEFEMYSRKDPDYNKINVPENDYSQIFDRECRERGKEAKEEPLTGANKTIEDTVQNIRPEDKDGPITLKEKIEHYMPRGLITEVSLNLPYIIIGSFAVGNVYRNLKK